jgi:hypothetical protein
LLQSTVGQLQDLFSHLTAFLASQILRVFLANNRVFGEGFVQDGVDNGLGTEIAN